MDMTQALSRTFAALTAGGLAMGVSTVGATAQTAPAPIQLVQSQDWNAFTSQAGSPKTCYAISSPKTLEPPTLNHGNVFFFITTKPAEKIRNEPSFQVGYPFKEGTKVSVTVDTKKFELFTKGDGAWLETPADEAKLIDALKKGKKLVVGGTSGRGNATTYTFSLAGLSGALDAVAKECK